MRKFINGKYVEITEADKTMERFFKNKGLSLSAKRKEASTSNDAVEKRIKELEDTIIKLTAKIEVLEAEKNLK
jgi:phage shock protein A